MKKGRMLSLEESPYHDGIGLRGAQTKIIAFCSTGAVHRSTWYDFALGTLLPLLHRMAKARSDNYGYHPASSNMGR